MREVQAEVVPPPGEVEVVALGQPGREHVLAAEEGVVGEDEARHVHVQLVLARGPRPPQHGMLGHHSLGEEPEERLDL